MGLFGCAGVCVCMCAREREKEKLKIPLTGICIGLLCYSRLSGTLALTYLSMSEQAAENKLICFSFYPPSSLSSTSFTCFLLSLSLYINLWLTCPFSVFLPSSHRYATTRCNIFLRPSFCPSSLCVFFSSHCENLNWWGRFFGVDTGFSCAQCYAVNLWSLQKRMTKTTCTQVEATNQIPKNTDK